MPPRLLATGFAQSTIMKFFHRIGISNPDWRYAGTPLEDLPRRLYQAELERADLRRVADEQIPAVLRWTPATKEQVKELSYRFMNDPDGFNQAVGQGIPEARAGIQQLQGLMERIRQYYVEVGILRPDQRFPVYFPVVRDTLEVQGERAILVEGGGYWPMLIQNRLGRVAPVFARARRVTDPELMPRQVSFDDALSLYLDQYARVRSIRNLRPDLEQILAQAPLEPSLQRYAADHLNFWMGVPGAAKRMSEWNQGIRDVQFFRTIGWGVLSPVVNTLQRLNTLALVHPRSFAQAFADVRDPARLALVEQSVFGRSLLRGTAREFLEKLGIEEPVGTGELPRILRSLAEKSGRMFSASEKGNRLHALMSGLREAERRGIQDVPGQLRFAELVLKDSQFIHTPADMVPLFRGPMGRVLGQFQTFRINQFRFMLRLLDEAQQGVRTGEFSRTLPFLKYFGASGVLGGGSAVLFGDPGEELATRHILGRAAHVPGLIETLFGVSLSHQLGLGAVGIEDLQSFLFYLPGPTVGMAQALLGATTGLSFGRGLQVGDAGRELEFDERLRLMLQSAPAPGALQANRAVQMLRLIQTNGEFREALDIPEALGLRPASGDLLAEKAATTLQILGAFVGTPSADRERERRKLFLERGVERDWGRTAGRAGTLLVSGRPEAAQREVEKFYRRYQDSGITPPAISPQTIRAAMRRQMLPPGARQRLPAFLQGSELAEETPSLFEVLGTQ